MDRFHNLESQVRIKIRKAVKSQWFYWTILLCVFLNTVSLATEHHQQPEWLGEFQGKLDRKQGHVKNASDF